MIYWSENLFNLFPLIEKLRGRLIHEKKIAKYDVQVSDDSSGWKEVPQSYAEYIISQKEK